MTVMAKRRKNPCIQKSSYESLQLDPAVFVPDYASDSSGKNKPGQNHHDEESYPMLICAF
jgi:hypothetical protein